MTSMTAIPSQKIKALLSEFGYLSSFTIDETGQTFSAPVTQTTYPRETSSKVQPESAIIGIQQLGENGMQIYQQDINFRLHLWTSTSGTASFSAYKARINEIIIGLQRLNWRNSDSTVQIMIGGFVEGGETPSGRIVYTAPVRAIIDYP